MFQLDMLCNLIGHQWKNNLLDTQQDYDSTSSNSTHPDRLCNWTYQCLVDSILKDMSHTRIDHNQVDIFLLHKRLVNNSHLDNSSQDDNLNKPDSHYWNMHPHQNIHRQHMTNMVWQLVYLLGMKSVVR